VEFGQDDAKCDFIWKIKDKLNVDYAKVDPDDAKCGFNLKIKEKLSFALLRYDKKYTFD